MIDATIDGQMLRDRAPVASAGLAAVAASAAWGSVLLSRRQWLAAHVPHLVAQALENGSDIELRVLNTGPGSCRGLQFCIATAHEYVAGYAGPQLGGALQPDERATVGLELSGGAGDAVTGVVTAWDAAGRLHIVTMDGARRTLRAQRRTRRLAAPVEAYEHVVGPLGARRRRGGIGKAKRVGAG